MSAQEDIRKALDVYTTAWDNDSMATQMANASSKKLFDAGCKLSDAFQSWGLITSGTDGAKITHHTYAAMASALLGDKPPWIG